jgi:hypothetical protein
MSILHAQIQWLGYVLLLVYSPWCLDIEFNGPYLFLQLNLMVIVAPPPELLLSPKFGKICKCSKVLSLEPSPVNPTIGSRLMLPLLRFGTWKKFIGSHLALSLLIFFQCKLTSALAHTCAFTMQTCTTFPKISACSVS